jgi:hypothetical protein
MADRPWEFADSELHAAILRGCSTDIETLGRIGQALRASLGNAEDARDCPDVREKSTR